VGWLLFIVHPSRTIGRVRSHVTRCTSERPQRFAASREYARVASPTFGDGPSPRAYLPIAPTSGTCTRDPNARPERAKFEAPAGDGTGDTGRRYRPAPPDMQCGQHDLAVGDIGCLRPAVGRSPSEAFGAPIGGPRARDVPFGRSYSASAGFLGAHRVRRG
jgi:hypothetical protein